MLARLENLYLDILRIITLAIATIALIAFAIALFNARGMLSELAPSPPPPISRDSITFDAYMRAVHPTEINTPPSEEAAADTAPLPLHEATRQLMAYFVRVACRGNCYGTDRGFESRILAELEQARDTFDHAYRADYEASILAFATGLNAAEDARLSSDDFAQALAWHDGAFRAAVFSVQSDREYRREQALASAGFAGLSLATFLIILFFFVLVKIERNLRLVRTQAADVG